MQQYGPIRYFGGKGNFVQRIIDHFPDPATYTCYVEPYGGSASVLLNKPYTPVEIYNDLERNVYTLFNVLSSPRLYPKLKRKCDLALYHEALAERYRLSLRDGRALSPLERAFRFWYVNRTRRVGDGGFSVNTCVRRGMSKSTSDFLASIERMDQIHARLSSVIFTNKDALALLVEHDYPGTMFYLDPPYVHATRGSTRYALDADDSHHERLVETLLTMRHAKVLLSGYDHVLYEPLVGAGWHRHQFEVQTVTGTNTPKVKTETLWANYAPAAQQLELFDEVV